MGKAMAGRISQVENSVRLIVLLAMLIMAPIRADPETSLLTWLCVRIPPNNSTLFEQILDATLASVVKEVALSGFVTKEQETSTDTTTASVYVLAQCRKDKSPADSFSCIKVAENQIRNCSGVSAIAYYDGCYLRYADSNFYDQYNDVTHKHVCGTVEAADSSSFSATGRSLISDLCKATPRINGYFAAQTRQGPSNATIYGLAFCLRSIQRKSCESCLNIAQDNINNCFPLSDGRAMDDGCYLRYDSKPFFPSNATVDLARFLPRGNRASSPKLIIIAVAGGVFLLALLYCLLVFRKQIIRPSQKKADIEGASELRGPEDFEFKILKKATNNFDQANKLGQGGFGEVFKGTLKNGKVVAVKKLKLGKNKRLLSWKERFNIILGTARGLAYLHEEFHVCIIHRDIKPSNILLDHNFQPKIADFGLARLLPNDKTHVSTRVAGTLGYTAPEYCNRGQLTEKADTYSFGVVVLEIISGRKSIDLKQPPDMEYLLQWVWSLYEDDKVLRGGGK
ncbi:hypothetical protein SUGI_1102620 [Cryptomeria japonica]|nr:hypothetical protein SUGI_1102620 [Cryptomeria japonica]